MRPAHRREAAPIIDRLLAAPQEFEFIQAVRILLAWLARQGVAPDEALRTRLRFENSLRLGFPAAEIEALSTMAVGSEAGAEAEGAAGFAITPAFMGLLGAHGALPAHVTERIAAWQADHDDPAPRAFLDMLSGRMLALFYRAWHKHRIEYTHSEYKHTVSDGGLQAMLLALAAASQSAQGSGTTVLPAALFAHFAGLLHQRPLSAVVLERLVASYFGATVRIEETVGHWDALAPSEQSALGVNARLGDNTLLGERNWRPDLRARLRIGPLGRDMFARFLPGGTAAEALRAILQAVAGPTVGFEVQLILRAEDVAPSRLGGAASAPACLGRDSFMTSNGTRTDRTDMRYLLLPMAPLPPRA
jgi:type VI secretion system protein ImpH